MRQLSKALVRLNLETRSYHVEADATWIALVDTERGVTRADYIAQLIRTYGFDAPLEAALAYTPYVDAFVRTPQRWRSGLIAQDLLNLGLAPDELSRVPQCMIAPFTSVAEALGWLYVHERATLLHDSLRPALVRRMPELAGACSYLGAHEGKVGMRWDELGQALDQAARVPGVLDRIIDAAHDAFRRALSWQQHEPRQAQTA